MARPIAPRPQTAAGSSSKYIQLRLKNSRDINLFKETAEVPSCKENHRRGQVCPQPRHLFARQRNAIKLKIAHHEINNQNGSRCKPFFWRYRTSPPGLSASRWQRFRTVDSLLANSQTQRCIQLPLVTAASRRFSDLRRKLPEIRPYQSTIARMLPITGRNS